MGLLIVDGCCEIIANLVEGEITEVKNTERDERSPKWSEETLLTKDLSHDYQYYNLGCPFEYLYCWI